MNTKVCTICKQDKPMDCFYKSNKYKDGHIAWCIDCTKAKDAISRARPEARELARQRTAEWRQRRAAGDKEPRRFPHAKSYAQLLEARRGQFRVNNLNHLARKWGVSGALTMQDWIGIRQAYCCRCLRCGRTEPEIVLVVEHVIPMSRGGTNTRSNLQLLCQRCNASKGNKSTDYRANPNGEPGPFPVATRPNRQRRGTNNRTNR